ncbi:SDR family oxidoreductase [Methanosarcina sp. KYL-1]|nr:SDR family oxidoreductase [Methanosarcina sp. KYL-1]MCQ1535394.1 SDR family oxidoreductase [Methanosarcina sp. KYL-1]
MSLTGQTAIVTGGGRGIGRAVCLSLAKEGANIVIVARHREEIEETARMVKNIGTRALVIQADVRNEADVRDMILTTIEKCGRLDILVNNAGIAHRKPIEETSLKEYEEVMDTNVKGVFLCSKHAIPYLSKSDNGKIINISSGGGKHGLSDLSVYCASKFAVNGMTEALASELSGRVMVYSVCPGAVDTEMYRSIFGDRPALKPDHVAEKVLELSLPESNVISGSIIEVYAPPVPLL